MLGILTERSLLMLSSVVELEEDYGHHQMIMKKELMCTPTTPTMST